MTPKLRMTAIGLLLGLAGCGTSASIEASLPTVAASPAEPPEPPVTAPAVPGGSSSRCTSLKLALTTDHPSYPAGRQVVMTARLTNAGAGSCTVALGAELGFTISRGAAPLWSGGCSSTAQGHDATSACPQFQTVQSLSAGQTLTRTQRWSQQRDAPSDGKVAQVPAGDYTARETWAGVTAAASFTVS